MKNLNHHCLFNSFLKRNPRFYFFFFCFTIFQVTSGANWYPFSSSAKTWELKQTFNERKDQAYLLKTSVCRRSNEAAGKQTTNRSCLPPKDSQVFAGRTKIECSSTSNSSEAQENYTYITLIIETASDN